MAALYLVRHAQASYGTEDYDRLSALGWRQARWLGEYFAERGMRFDVVLRGTLRRHAETLAGIAEGMGSALPERQDAGLNEYDSLALLRAHTGLDAVQEADRQAHFRLLREALYAWARGSLERSSHEPFAEFRARVLAALAPVCAGSARSVLVVSSGGPISMILAEVLGIAAHGVVDLNLQSRNTGITELRYRPRSTPFDVRAMRCVSFNNVPHLDRPDRAGTLTYA
jgi:broad specificity phosphatase PhoE